jgi:hypothetical protein
MYENVQIKVSVVLFLTMFDKTINVMFSLTNIVRSQAAERWIQFQRVNHTALVSDIPKTFSNQLA